MTENEFRVKHSQIIEYYQYTEEKLRGYCAELLADEEHDWFSRLDDYSNDALGKLIIKTKKAQKSTGINFLTDEDFLKLDTLREDRNYWCHGCFRYDRPIVFRKNKDNGQLCVYQKDIADRLDKNLIFAMEVEERLAEVNNIFSMNRKK